MQNSINETHEPDTPLANYPFSHVLVEDVFLADRNECLTSSMDKSVGFLLTERKDLPFFCPRPSLQVIHFRDRSRWYLWRYGTGSVHGQRHRGSSACASGRVGLFRRMDVCIRSEGSTCSESKT